MEIKQTPEEIAGSIVDELEAMSIYARMAAETTDPVLRAILMNIAGDEYGHARTFMVWQELMGAASTPPVRRTAGPYAGVAGPGAGLAGPDAGLAGPDAAASEAVVP